MAENNDVEYVQLMDLCVRVAESIAGIPSIGNDAWIKDAENLSIKLFYHLGSLYYLTRGTNLPSLGGIEVQYIDNASVNVIARAAFETYLTYFYIFVAPSNNRERLFRYKIWDLGGLIERQKFPISTKEGKEFLKQELDVIKSLAQEVQEDSLYKGLSNRRQQQAKEGKWRFDKEWADLAELAGFSKSYFNGIYRYLSAYAHSTSLSSIQIEASAANRNSQLELAKTILGVGKVLMGHFIFSFVSIFSKANTVLGAYPDAAVIAEIWNGIGRDW